MAALSIGRIAAAVAAGFLLRWYLSWLLDPQIKAAVDSVLRRYVVTDHDLQAYAFWRTSSMFIVHLILNIVVGFLVAMVAKGRELTATITLAVVSIVAAIFAILMTISRTGDYGVLGTLPHTFAFSIAIVVAGAVVHARRSAATTRPIAM